MNKGDVVGAALQVNKEDEEKARLLEALKKHKKEKKQKKKEKRKVNIVMNRFTKKNFIPAGCSHDRDSMYYRERGKVYVFFLSLKRHDVYYFVHTFTRKCENLQVG